MTTEQETAAWGVIAENLAAMPYFRQRSDLMHHMRRRIATLRGEVAVVPFAFDGRHTFYTRQGRWTPKALQPALLMFLAAHCRGGEVMLPYESLRAAHGAIDRQIESLARVDIVLANALGFARGDAPGLHLRSDYRGRPVCWLHWQAPHCLRLGPPVTAL